MNVVSQLWSRVSGYYRTLNPATLSGAIDVIVIAQPDGSLRSSPFHARFGKSGILRPQDNVVELYVNDELVPDIHMKLGEAGEAFFLAEPSSSDESFPTEQLPVPPSVTVTTAIQMQDRRDLQGNTEDSGSSSSAEADDAEGDAERRDAAPSSHQLAPPATAPPLSCYSDCEGEERNCGGVSSGGGIGSRRGTMTGYKSDSEQDCGSGGGAGVGGCGGGPGVMIGSAADQLMAHMDWEWGQLPHSATMDSVKSADYFDCSDEPTAAAAADEPASGAIKLSGELVSSEKLNRIFEERMAAAGSSNSGDQLQPQGELDRFVHSRTRESSERERLSSSGECYLSDLDDTNRHLYLSGSPASPESGYKSDQDVEEDLNVGVQMSLCGGLDLPNSLTTERFLKYLVSYEEFLQNPDLIDNKDLVVRIQGRNYNWRTAAPILLCRAAFRVALPYKTVQGLKERHMRFRRKRNMVRSWFGWGGGGAKALEDAEANEEEAAAATPAGTDKVEANGASVAVSVKDIKETEPEAKEASEPCQKQQLVRTVRLTSSQLKKLNLRPGYNELRYSITTKFQGTTACTCGVYLWSHDDRIVISDIDGTITKSDVLGHILPMVGKDWTQPRIAQLFSAIEQNDYRFVYLSARAIGQSAVTRRFLQRVRQEGVPLPDGPVLLSPLSLVRAFHQEVIARRPEAFKIACLKDVGAIFPAGTQPFWAGFGNRPSDARSYTEVGIQRSRCFTVNPQGEVTRESGDCLPSSYKALTEVADLVFPPFQHSFADHGSFSHFSYWREPLPELQIFEVEEPPKPEAAAVTLDGDGGAAGDGERSAPATEAPEPTAAVAAP